MSGGSVPYHLRSNKSVDRSIFMELLMKMHTLRKINNYRYIGFGAPHMEDFKLIHSLFSIKKLTCLEYNDEVHKRQKFNRPLKCISLLKQTSGEYITNYEVGKNSIVWLDYADPRQLRLQISEFQQLLQKTMEYDIVKITLNASPNSLVDKSHEKAPIILNNKRFEVLSERLGVFLPTSALPNMMTVKSLPKVLLQSLLIASDQVLIPVLDLQFIPLCSFTYNDGPHQMITLTGIILNKSNKTKILKESGFLNWEYFIGNYNEPLSINMPDLTLRERLAIDALLPNSTAKTIQKKLKIFFDENEKKSLERLDSYAKFYRHYPHFSRINM
ncbi:hypothetical protein QIH01_02825 [Brevibacillus brevis]|nr:hypothetical protein QIH01_02825 [Brevibacillus brevis]